MRFGYEGKSCAHVKLSFRTQKPSIINREDSEPFWHLIETLIEAQEVPTPAPVSTSDTAPATQRSLEEPQAPTEESRQVPQLPNDRLRCTRVDPSCRRESCDIIRTLQGSGTFKKRGLNSTSFPTFGNLDLKRVSL